MPAFLDDLEALVKQRTHTCGELSENDVGKTVVLQGWVHSRRNLGGLVFLLLRDRFGFTQVVVNPENAAADIVEAAHGLTYEFVVEVEGKVGRRPSGQENLKQATGAIEVEVSALKILNASKPLPFLIEEDSSINEDLRLKYRYLDLRRPQLQRHLVARHKAAQITRNMLSDAGFLEVETPILTKSTPEGARDYLVPSRVSKGNFYALPQSPQLFKQL
ncbi:MAG: aspartate--tRNA ligase, partial [Deltaproteobacteria bacterium]|nr:aspartate--tRNA ligase [Deltaproteobacteria bacterium]